MENIQKRQKLSKTICIDTFLLQNFNCMNYNPKSAVIDHLNRLSVDTFLLLTRMFVFKLSMSEIGITDRLIFELTDIITKFKLLNVEIYRSNSTIESLLGNDLDIFFEVKNDLYVYLTFQAKVLSHNAKFKELVDKDGTPQWDKLEYHRWKFGSKPYYLLYIGNPKNNTINSEDLVKDYTDCLGNLSNRELGISVIELDKIIALRKNKTRTSPTSFSEIPIKSLIPFRSLFCEDFFKNHKIQSLKKYSKKDINLKNYDLVTEYIEREDFLRIRKNNDELNENVNSNSKYIVIINKQPKEQSVEQRNKQSIEQFRKKLDEFYPNSEGI